MLYLSNRTQCLCGRAVRGGCLALSQPPRLAQLWRRFAPKCHGICRSSADPPSPAASLSPSPPATLRLKGRRSPSSLRATLFVRSSRHPCCCRPSSPSPPCPQPRIRRRPPHC
eukprot:1301147-Rhodomonas_salina.3